MDKNNKIVISTEDWLKGIGQSEFVGNQDVFLLDTDTKKGALMVNYKTTKESGNIINDYPVWSARDDDIVFIVDRSGYVYKRNNGTWSDVSNTTRDRGQGLAHWKGYLFVFRDTTIDITGDDGTSWTTAWKTVGSSDWHPTFVATNDTLYFGCGQYLGSIKEIGTFDPTDNNTFEFKAGTSSDNALDLTSGSEIRDINQLNTLLYLGTNNEELNRSDIFPWDTVSEAFYEPIKFSTPSLSAMLSYNNLIYVWGRDGSIKVTNGSSVQEIAKIPRNEIGNDLDNIISVSPSTPLFWRNKIFFPVSGKNSCIWSLDGNILKKEYIISTGDEANNTLRVLEQGGKISSDDTLLLGWKVTTGQGMDKIESGKYYNNYEARFISQFYMLGDEYNKKAIKDGFLFLGKAIATDEGIKLYYRRENNDNWTLHQTFTDNKSTHSILAITNIDKIQFKIEIKASETTTPELLKISLNL